MLFVFEFTEVWGLPIDLYLAYSVPQATIPLASTPQGDILLNIKMVVTNWEPTQVTAYINGLPISIFDLHGHSMKKFYF